MYNDYNMNRKLIFILIVTLFALSFSVFQYVKEFQSEIADAAYTSKPTMGHSWTEMECSEGLCVTTDNKVGIGTSTPGSKLDVAGTINSSSFSTSGNITSAGSITATGDVCGAGACLSQIASFVGSQPLVNNVHNYTACTNAGGTVTPSDVSFPMCKFSASSCPTSANSNGTGTWTQYKSYGTYGPTHL